MRLLIALAIGVILAIRFAIDASRAAPQPQRANAAAAAAYATFAPSDAPSP